MCVAEAQARDSDAALHEQRPFRAGRTAGKKLRPSVRPCKYAQQPHADADDAPRLLSESDGSAAAQSAGARALA